MATRGVRDRQQRRQRRSSARNRRVPWAAAQNAITMVTDAALAMQAARQRQPQGRRQLRGGQEATPGVEADLGSAERPAGIRRRAARCRAGRPRPAREMPPA